MWTSCNMHELFSRLSKCWSVNKPKPWGEKSLINKSIKINIQIKKLQLKKDQITSYIILQAHLKSFQGNNDDVQWLFT